MTLFKRLSLILLVICALFADVVSGITPIVMAGTAVILVMYIIKNNSTIKKNKYYLIIYLNILCIAITSIFNFSFTNIKYIIYLISTLIIMEIVEKEDLYYIFKITYLLSILLSVYLLIIGYKVNSVGNISNVRNYIILQKQSINVIFSVIIPYNILLIKDNKKIKYVITLLLFLFVSIFIMQVKSLIVTLPAAFLVYQMINSRVKVSTILKFLLFTILLIFILYVFDLIPQLTPIIDYLIYGDESIYLGNKYLDTLILRKEIIVFCFEILSNFLFWGIGYGNYYMYSASKVYYVYSKGIYEIYPTVTENGIITFLVEGGVIGFIAHMFLLISIVLDLKKVLCKINNLVMEERVVILSFLSILISNFMQDNLNFTFWLLIGLSLNIIRVYSGVESRYIHKNDY